MPDMTSLNSGYQQQVYDQPHMSPPLECAECGLQISTQEIADECDLCGAPRCRSCASAAGTTVGDRYICSACADEDYSEV